MRPSRYRKQLASVALCVGLAVSAVTFNIAISVTPDGPADSTKSWTRTPDREHTVPFNQHGTTVYVTEANSRLMSLMWWLGLPAFLIGAGAGIFLKLELEQE